LAHEVQTVPRAELRAATIVVERSRGCVTIVTDCKMVKTGFDRGPGDRPRSALHADWQRFWSAVQNFEGELNVLWTKAHVVARDLRLGRSTPMDAYGNTAADKLAEIGASRCSVSDADAKAYQAETKLAGQVQRRRLAILLDILSRTTKVKRPKKCIKRKAASTLDLLKNTTHKLVIAGVATGVATALSAARSPSRRSAPFCGVSATAAARSKSQRLRKSQKLTDANLVTVTSTTSAT